MGKPMTATNVPNIDTGYRIVAGSIDSESGPSGYHIDGERILRGTVDTGYFLAGETIYRKPKLDTGFQVLGGVVWGPRRELPFLEQRPLAKTAKIDVPTAHAAAG
jgi:hypothetical protein